MKNVWGLCFLLPFCSASFAQQDTFAREIQAQYSSGRLFGNPMNIVVNYLRSKKANYKLELGLLYSSFFVNRYDIRTSTNPKDSFFIENSSWLTQTELVGTIGMVHSVYFNKFMTFRWGCNLGISGSEIMIKNNRNTITPFQHKNLYVDTEYKQGLGIYTSNTFALLIKMSDRMQLSYSIKPTFSAQVYWVESNYSNFATGIVQNQMDTQFIPDFIISGYIGICYFW